MPALLSAQGKQGRPSALLRASPRYLNPLVPTRGLMVIAAV